MELTETITKAVEPALTSMGYELVRVAIIGADIKTVQIMAERQDRKDMTVDDCEKISQTASALLDVADPFNGRWVLEVSSPGIDRPLVKPADYDRFKGEEAKVELLNDIDGRKRFKGILKGIHGTTITMDFEGQDITFDFADIAKAKLTFKDETLDNKKGKK
ncbi:MAG: ribosome maturation factor RimP [Alphaproteobacteria bacterium]|nr:ribosome maturation factor RimP [Alphaproteobacteria bacterium]